MPRKSAASLSVVRVDGKPERLKVPKGLHGEVAQVFSDVVRACAPNQFAMSDLPLLVSFCEARALAARASRELQRRGPVMNGKPSPWLSVAKEAWRAVAAMAGKLRLSPSSRYDARAGGRKAQRPPGPFDVDRFLEEHDD